MLEIVMLWLEMLSGCGIFMGDPIRDNNTTVCDHLELNLNMPSSMLNKLKKHLELTIWQKTYEGGGERLDTFWKSVNKIKQSRQLHPTKFMILLMKPTLQSTRKLICMAYWKLLYIMWSNMASVVKLLSELMIKCLY